MRRVAEAKLTKVIAFTGGVAAPGSRFRVRQYIPHLRESGIELVEQFPAATCYPPEQKIFRPLWAVGSLAERIPGVLNSFRYDLSFFQREMLSTLITLEPFTKRPRVLDVDDAIWIHRGGATARRLAALCDSIICGNAFLADHFGQWNRNITIIPTAVDTDRFRPGTRDENMDRPVIGWSGGQSGLAELYRIESALSKILTMHPRAMIRVLCDSPPRFRDIRPERIEYVPWSPEAEVPAIQQMTAGVMPLTDTPWNRGKCSYKMLLSMACAVPMVVSPVGMNQDVLRLGNCGLAADSLADWVDGLDLFLSNPSHVAKLGQTGRGIVLKHFSLGSVAPRLANELAFRAAGGPTVVAVPTS